MSNIMKRRRRENDCGESCLHQNSYLMFGFSAKMFFLREEDLNLIGWVQSIRIKASEH